MSYQLWIQHVDNDTILASLVGPGNTSVLEAVAYRRQDGPYDSVGALYYVVAVVFLYGFSIILMIGSLIKKTEADHGVSKYMSDLDKIRRLERRQQKYKTRLAMLQTQKRRPSSARPSTDSAMTTSEAAQASKWANVSLWANINLDRTASTWSLPSVHDQGQVSPLLGRQTGHQSEPSSPTVPERSVRICIPTDEDDSAPDVFVTPRGSIQLDPADTECASVSSIPDTAPVDGATAVFVCVDSERDFKQALAKVHMDTVQEEEEEETKVQ